MNWLTSLIVEGFAHASHTREALRFSEWTLFERLSTMAVEPS
jgi:hypothetical protein